MCIRDSCKAVYAGSIPTLASIFLIDGAARRRPARTDVGHTDLPRWPQHGAPLPLSRLLTVHMTVRNPKVAHAPASSLVLV